MFLRVISSLSRTLHFSRLTSARFASQTQPNPVERRLPPVNCSSKSSPQPLTALSPDVASSMKFSVIKRVPRKKPAWKTTNASNLREEQLFNVSALATADWYDLERLKQRFAALSLPFQLVPISDMINDVLCVQISSATSPNKSEAFIFDDGAVVFWNVQEEHKKLIQDQVKFANLADYFSDRVFFAGRSTKSAIIHIQKN